MRDNETTRFEMFQRVVGFGNDEAARFASNPYVTSLFDELGGVVADIQARVDAQTTGRASARQSTLTKSAAREDALEILNAMRRTARNIPGQEEEFNFSKNPKDQELLSLARTFAAKALPVKAEFTKRGMRIDFIEVLQADADAIEQSLSERAEKRRSHVNATANIDDLIDAGMTRIRELDTIMRNLFADDPGRLAAWVSASHVARTPRSPAPAPPPAPTT
jgi:hypothetical protein